MQKQQTKTDSEGNVHPVGRKTSGEFTRAFEAGIRASAPTTAENRRKARNRRKRAT